MSNYNDIVLPVIVATTLLLVMVVIMGFLMVVNTSRRHQYRAELAEVQQERDRTIRKVEREATEQTLVSMGRELHDGVGQSLQFTQHALMKRLAPQLSHDSLLASAMDSLEEGILEVKRLGRSLNDELWHERSLEEAVRMEVLRIERIGGIQVELHVDGETDLLEDDRKTILFRCFQQVISNALKHSEADIFQIGVDGGPPFRMSITDNGVGFDPNSVKKGSGLINIKKRCELVGFTAKLETAAGQGCRWTFVADHDT